MANGEYRVAGTVKLTDIASRLASTGRYLSNLADELLNVRQTVISNWTGDTTDIQDLIKRLDESHGKVLNFSAIIVSAADMCLALAREAAATASNKSS